jgi:hypothetical protein
MPVSVPQGGQKAIIREPSKKCFAASSGYGYPMLVLVKNTGFEKTARCVSNRMEKGQFVRPETGVTKPSVVQLLFC